jgi:hypothetical protein
MKQYALRQTFRFLPPRHFMRPANQRVHIDGPAGIIEVEIESPDALRGLARLP